MCFGEARCSSGDAPLDAVRRSPALAQGSAWRPSSSARQLVVFRGSKPRYICSLPVRSGSAVRTAFESGDSTCAMAVEAHSDASPGISPRGSYRVVRTGQGAGLSPWKGVLHLLCAALIHEISGA